MTLLIAAITTSQTIALPYTWRGIERRLEREKFAEETGRGRQAEQREQEQREACREHRLLLAEARVVANRQALFVLLAEVRDHEERADLHQHVGREIKEHGGDAESVEAAKATRMYPACAIDE